MPGTSDVLPDFEKVALRRGKDHLLEDFTLLARGVLDRASFVSGWKKMRNPVEVRTTSLVADDVPVQRALLVKDPALFTEPYFDGKVWRDKAWGNQRRVLREVRRQHNLRTTMGRDQWQRVLMCGDVGSTVGDGKTGALTAATATTATPSGGGLSTAATSAGNTGLQGKVIFVGPNNSGVGSAVFGVIVSNTATVITVDQWYAIPVTGAAGTAPNATGNYVILPGAVWAVWVGLVTNAAAAAAGDVLRTADGLFGDGTTAAASTELVSGTGGGSGANVARAYLGQGGTTAPTYGSGTYVLAHTWTYNGTGAQTVHKVIMCNSLAAAGSLLFLETVLNADGTVTASGDTIQVTWTVTL